MPEIRLVKKYPHIKDEDVIKVCKKVGLDYFIKALPSHD